MKEVTSDRGCPCHPTLEEYLNTLDRAAQISRVKTRTGPVFRSVGKGDRLGDRPIYRFDVRHMIKRRAEAAALSFSACCYAFIRLDD